MNIHSVGKPIKQLYQKVNGTEIRVVIQFKLNDIEEKFEIQYLFQGNNEKGIKVEELQFYKLFILDSNDLSFEIEEEGDLSIPKETQEEIASIVLQLSKTRITLNKYQKEINMPSIFVN